MFTRTGLDKKCHLTVYPSAWRIDCRSPASWSGLATRISPGCRYPKHHWVNSFSALTIGREPVARAASWRYRSRTTTGYGGRRGSVPPFADSGCFCNHAIRDRIDRFDGQANVFVKKLADEFAQLFAETPILGGRSRARIQFQTISAGAIGAVMTEVDSGRFLHLVFFIDGLNGFDQDSLAGINADTIDLSAAIRKHIELASKAAIEQPGFRDGITLVVSCGFGRGAYFGIDGGRPQHWRLESIPAHDLITLGWVPDFRPVNLWSLLDARQATDRQGIRLFNINGLLNLAAWARELDGHLVPQGQLPDDVVGRHGDNLLVVVRQNAVRDLRYGVLVRCDPRRILDADACWVKVRKLDESEFEEDNRAPLYASEEDALREGCAQFTLLVHGPGG